ncbi:MAG TPA: hypothetical protein VMB26_12095, partial [Candidatus Binataceae bacterium]|nr:hypothetical protein [Candidatus Binataceae bacterium]
DLTRRETQAPSPSHLRKGGIERSGSRTVAMAFADRIVHSWRVVVPQRLQLTMQPTLVPLFFLNDDL